MVEQSILLAYVRYSAKEINLSDEQIVKLTNEIIRNMAKYSDSEIRKVEHEKYWILEKGE